jgi:hypothetical protein
MKDISGETVTDRKQDLVGALLFLEAWERGFIPRSRAASVLCFGSDSSVGPILNSRT